MRIAFALFDYDPQDASPQAFLDRTILHREWPKELVRRGLTAHTPDLPTAPG